MRAKFKSRKCQTPRGTNSRLANAYGRDEAVQDKRVEQEACGHEPPVVSTIVHDQRLGSSPSRGNHAMSHEPAERRDWITVIP